tara:strand:- start:291 stop:821 length:531 start_codon:yes stop_codon:yes gene_type:complete
MPRKAIDYSKTIIYKIQHEDNDELLYVGHTTDFTKRKCQHKCSCNCETNSKYNMKIYKMIRENGGWDCFKILEIKKFPCNDANEARAEEDHIMQEMKATMNTHRSYTGLTRHEYIKQYNIDNSDRRKQNRIYDADKISERHKQKITCECGLVICKYGLQKHKRTSKHLDLMMIKKN